MKLTALITVILLSTIGLASNHPGFPQTAANSQLKQAFGTQNWRRTIQAVNQMNRDSRAKFQSNSKLTLYQALRSHR
jgi:uncharacterized protein YdeI (BOF family)